MPVASGSAVTASTPPAHAASPGRLKSRLRAATRVLSGVALAAVLVWLGVNVYPYAAPEPLWTPADLPTMPADSTNGWFVIVNEVEVLEVPAELATIIDGSDQDPKTAWARVEREAEGLHELLETSAGQAATERVDGARRLPAFVAACDWDAPCPIFAWSRAHDGALFRALALAHAGELADSAMLLRDLIRMDASLLGNSKSLLTVLLGLKHLDQTLYAADVFVASLQPDGLDTQTRAALTELAAGVRLVTPTTVDLRQIVIADYLFQLDILNTLGGDGDRSGSNWLLNRGLTLRELNEKFEGRYAAAIAGDKSAALGDVQDVDRPWGWWFRNSVGKQLLEMLNHQGGHHAVTIDEHLATIEQASVRLLDRPALRSL